MPLPFLAHLRGRLDECILLTYRTPLDSVRHLLPPHLEPITHRVHGGGVEWAFWNIAMCSIEQLRPFPAPRALGMACQLVAYRLLVKAGDLPGTHFCRTDIDHSLLARTTALSGELAARRRSCQIFIATPGRRVQFIVRTNDRLGDAEVVVAPPLSPKDEADERDNPAQQARLHLAGVTGDEQPQCDSHNICIPPPERSIFASIDEARRVLTTQPVAFAPSSPARLKLVRMQRDNDAWDERPIVVHSARFGYLASLGQTDLSLELAVRVQPIDCGWRVGQPAKTG